MKVTKSQLKQIIKEELEATIQEGWLQDKLHAIQDSGAWEEFKEFWIESGQDMVDALDSFTGYDKPFGAHAQRRRAKKERQRKRQQRIRDRGAPPQQQEV